MQRHVRLVSDYPTVVSGRAGWDVKQVARFHFDHFPALDRGRGASRNDQSHMFDVAVAFSNVWANMLRPFPTRQVRRTANRHSTEVDYFELAFFERPNFVGFLESFQNDVKHRLLPIVRSATPLTATCYRTDY
jgi:hypothetical protein